MALGASRLTGDTTRFKASYTANLPLLPPPVAPPRSTSPFLSRLLRFAISTDIEEGHDYAEDCYAYNGPPCLTLPPPVAPPLSLALRFAMSTPRIAMPTPRIAMSTPRIAMSTPRIAMSTPRNAQAVFRFRQRPPYNDFLRRGPRLFDPPTLGLPS